MKIENQQQNKEPIDYSSVNVTEQIPKTEESNSCFNSCANFFWKTKQRKIITIGTIVFFILLSIAGFVVAMLIVSGDIKINQSQRIKGMDGQEYDYNQLTYRESWMSEEYKFHTMAPVLNGRLMQGSDSDLNGCIFAEVPDAGGMVKTCNGIQSEILIDGQQLLQRYNNEPQEEGESRLLTEEDIPALLNALQAELSFDEMKDPIVSQVNVVEVDAQGNIVQGGSQSTNKDNTRRILLWKKWKTITKAIQKAVAQTLNVVKKAGPVIGAAVGFALGGPAGACLGMKIGTVAQIALKSCYPGNSDQIRFKCDGLQLMNQAHQAGMSYGVKEVAKQSGPSFLKPVLSICK